MSFFRKTEAPSHDTHLSKSYTRDFDIDERISTRAKRLALKVNFTSGRIELVIPKRAPQYMIERFLVQQRDWIMQRQAEMPKSILFIDGQKLSICGNAVTIRIHKDTSIKRTKIAFNDNILDVTTYLDNASARIQRYLKQHAKTQFELLVSQKTRCLGLPANSLSVRDTKSRWGSCSQDGDISLSWRLIFAPYDAMDYVIAHEVAHLKHMDHSHKFWKVCEELCLNYKAGKTWMKENGTSLMRYGR